MLLINDSRGKFWDVLKWELNVSWLAFAWWRMIELRCHAANSTRGFFNFQMLTYAFYMKRFIDLRNRHDLSNWYRQLLCKDFVFQNQNVAANKLLARPEQFSLYSLLWRILSSDFCGILRSREPQRVDFVGWAYMNDEIDPLCFHWTFSYLSLIIFKSWGLLP